MNGEELEQFVRRLETSLLPPGFTVETRQREYGNDGVQIAEFDLVVTGRLGSAAIDWLIECRDRPSEGAAPGAWIEQLVGRRSRFNFDKVMAVSTTGFAPGAVEYAQESGIELRSVDSLDAVDMTDWLLAQELQLIQRHVHLSRFRVLIAETEPQDRMAAAHEVVRAHRANDPALLNPHTGQGVTAIDSFLLAVSRRPNLWPTTPVDGWSSDVEFVATYPANDCYVLDTSVGWVRIPQIQFAGVLSVSVQGVPFSRFLAYRDQVTGERIVATAVAEITLEERRYAVALENVTVDGTNAIRLHARETT